MQEIDATQVFAQDQPYYPAHVFLVLELISKELIVGRYSVERETGLSNNAARSLLQRLAALDLIQPIQRKGHGLTKIGERFVALLQKNLPFNGPFSLPDLVPEPSHLVQMRAPQSLSRNGLAERDLAVRYGARGGVTLRYHQQRLFIPGIELEEPIDPAVSKMIQKRLDPQENDALFIAFADTPEKAAIAGLTVALRVIGLIEPLF